MTPARIAVIGGSAAARLALVELLEQVGLPGASAAEAPAGEPPDLVVLPADADPAATCPALRELPGWLDRPVFALVPAIPAAAAADALAAGADEVLAGEPGLAVFGARCRGLVARARDRRRLAELDELAEATRRVHDAIAAGGDSPEALHEVMLVAMAALGYERASLIACVESSDHAFVVAATDDPGHGQFALAITSYPEVLAAMRTGEPVIVDDTATAALTAPVAELLARHGVASVAVFPAIWRKRSLGAMLLRKSQPGSSHLSPARRGFGVMLASQLAAELQGSQVIERLRDTTRRISRASYEAERRLRTIESLKEHFEASADGVVVLDEQGHILFVNGAAESITGFARDGLLGSGLVDMVAPEQREALDQVIRSVLGGQNLEAFDLDLWTTSGAPICVSVTTSTVLARSDAVILSFRDVTAERALEAELEQTKDFLEKLIDSAVDAIVAADLGGHVILFNPGAERLYGYTADEVIGRISAADLYPEGAAADVMNLLRDEDHGGVGRLEQTRREIRARDGSLIPVLMTASIIYDQGREVATVGIFSDLRERLRIEERLVMAQEQLEQKERQAMVAQLAGAAAHELNQPLTSIMGYAQLIARQSDAQAPHGRALDVIQREAERMAEIVKKIGRITRYETKEYVGSASIVDLERSAAHGEGGVPQVEVDDEPTGRLRYEDLLKREAARAAGGTLGDDDGRDEPTVAERGPNPPPRR